MCLNKIINNKAKMISKKVAQKNYAKTVKKKVVIAQQMRQSRNNLIEFKRKKKEEYGKYKQSVYSDAGEKDKSVNNDQWPVGTTVNVSDSTV